MKKVREAAGQAGANSRSVPTVERGADCPAFMVTPRGRIALPAGLDWDMVQIAVEEIEAWELRADATATELVIRLYAVLCSP